MFKLTREDELFLCEKIVSSERAEMFGEDMDTRFKKDCGSNCSGKCGGTCQAACKSSCTSLF